MKQISMTSSKMSESLAQIDALIGVTPKMKGCLRLLTEEMYSMVRELLERERLDFSIKCDDNQFTLKITTQTRVNDQAREHFLSMSSRGENVAAKGIRGLLGTVLEMFSYGGDPEMHGISVPYGMRSAGGGCVSIWTLSSYMECAPKEEIRNEWDGMEKSIIANFADDVAIGVRNGMLEMTVTKAV